MLETVNDVDGTETGRTFFLKLYFPTRHFSSNLIFLGLFLRKGGWGRERYDGEWEEGTKEEKERERRREGAGVK